MPGLHGCSAGDAGFKSEEAGMIEALRTPDERFADLAGFSYPPSYVEDLPG
jgi:hypothetical protein